MNTIVEPVINLLSAEEQEKRNGLMARKPYVAQKLAKISEMEARGEISPIIRLEKSYLCNFQCTHCSAEYYMDRHYKNVLKVVDTRRKMDMEDVRRISREADELGLARFVITGGEPLVMKDFDEVVAALDPEKHYIITDTNGWFLDRKKAQHLKDIGVEKVQLSLDSFIEAEHDQFRNKPGSYKRVMRAIDACLDVGLNLILSTVLVRGRAKTEEFRQMCQFCTDKGIGLYVSYAKPTGSCTEHPEFVIEKEDADILREMEREFKVFSHMTPSYGSFKGCITVKGIITVTSSMEITPCPYIDFSIGNLRQNSLKEILDRGMRNPWLGPYRPDCIIGEDPKFIRLHTEKTKGAIDLPLPYGKGFTDEDSLTGDLSIPEIKTGALFDQHGRFTPITPLQFPHSKITRSYFKIQQPQVDFASIHARIKTQFSEHTLPSKENFQAKIESLVESIRQNAPIQDILNGVWIPFLIPKISCIDLGEQLEIHALPALTKSFETLGKGTFKRHWKSDLTGTLTTPKSTRHEQLITRLQQEAVMGCYFPSALSEFSLPATREIMPQLPDNILLSGAMDTCAALIGSPELLQNQEHYPPLLWFAAIDDADCESGLHLEAYGWDLTLNRRKHFGKNAEYWSSGLTILSP